MPVLPFSFVRRASDYSTSMSAVFSLSPDEKYLAAENLSLNLINEVKKLFCGLTMPTARRMRQCTNRSRSLWATGDMVFLCIPPHCYMRFRKVLQWYIFTAIGDDEADILYFSDTQKISWMNTQPYRKAAMPPLWSFGFWMSRITYFSEAEGREVTKKLRDNKIPSDVLHFDTGWFEKDWRCDYQFSKTRFTDAAGMMADFKKIGFQTSLWQLPYFVPKNTLFPKSSKRVCL